MLIFIQSPTSPAAWQRPIFDCVGVLNTYIKTKQRYMENFRQKLWEDYKQVFIWFLFSVKTVDTAWLLVLCVAGSIPTRNKFWYVIQILVSHVLPYLLLVCSKRNHTVVKKKANNKISVYFSHFIVYSESKNV